MKVTVIIPCYNVEKYITATLASVATQMHQNLEVICVNDGSTDLTVEKIEAFMASSDMSLTLIHQENQGAPAARNAGLKKASGEYIQFLDGDDLLKPDKITHQLALADANHFPDLIVGSYIKQDENGLNYSQREYLPSNISDPWLMVMQSDFGNTCANLFKATLFRTGLAWDTALASSQEYDLMFRILQQSKSIIFDQQLNTVINIRSGGSISQRNLAANSERYLELRIRIVNHLKENKIQTDMDSAYQILFDAIRTLYCFAPSKATAYFKQHIPASFVPRVSQATTKTYVTLYKILGFQNTEKIKALLGK